MKKIVSITLFIMIALSLISCSGYKSMTKGDTGIDIGSGGEKQIEAPVEKKDTKKGK